MENQNLLVLILGGMAVSVISITVTRSKAFKWLRDWLDTRNGTVFHVLANLFSCPFCFSFYVAFALHFMLLQILRFNALPQFAEVGIGITYLCFVGTAAIFSGLILLLFKFVENGDDDELNE